MISIIKAFQDLYENEMLDYIKFDNRKDAAIVYLPIKLEYIRTHVDMPISKSNELRQPTITLISWFKLMNVC